MTKKEIKVENANIDAFRVRIHDLEKQLQHASCDVKESLLTRMNVLRYKINAAQDRIDQSSGRSESRVFCKASDGYFKR